MIQINSSFIKTSLNYSKYRIIFFLLLSFIISFAINLSQLFSTPFAFGADGYYYASQIHYYFTKGHFFSPDSSLFLYFLSYFSLLWNDPILSNKIAIAFFSSLLVWPGYLIGKNLHNKKTGIVLSILLISNSFISFFIFEYVKNLGGIFAFLFFFNQVIVTLKNKISVKSLLLLFVFFILVFLSHKLMAAIAILFVLSIFSILLKSHWKKILFFILFLSTVLIFLIILLPNTLHLSDFSRFTNVLSWKLQWTPYTYISIAKPPVLLKIEIWILTASPLLILFYWKRLSPASKIIVILSLFFYALVNVPVLRFTELDLAFRLFILIFIPAGIFISLTFIPLKTKWIVLLVLIAFPYQYYNKTKIKSTPQFNYELYDDLLPLINLPKNSLLIMHTGFDYFYCYNEKGDAFHFLPEKKHLHRPLYRLAYGVSSKRIKKILPEIKYLQDLPGPYTLLKEKSWQTFLNNINSTEQKKILTWRNPHKHRPAYMLRNDKFLNK